MFTIQITPDTELLDAVYAGDRFGGNWLGQPVVLVDCGICNAIFRPPLPPPREDSHCTVNRPKGSD